MDSLTFETTTFKSIYMIDGEFENPPENYFCNFKINIYKNIIEDEDEEADEDLVLVGYIEGVWFDFEKASNDEINITEYLDGYTQEIANAFLSIMDFKKDYIKAQYMTEEYINNTIYLQKIYIYPKYRNQKIAETTIKNLDELLKLSLGNNFGIVLLMPSPFELENKDSDEENILKEDNLLNGEELTKKLIKFYRKYGFKNIRKPYNPETTVLIKQIS